MKRVALKDYGRDVISVAVTVGLISLLVYLPALSGGFINLDDPYYITNNPLIKNLDGSSLLHIFTESHLAAWLPLTYLSFALDYHFWGDNPLGYHLTNIILHAMNAALVVLLADRYCRKQCHFGEETSGGRWLYPGMLLFAGLLFGLHPLRVESVAWAAERKDVLNGFFTIAAVIAYGRYVSFAEEGGRGWRRRGAYLLSLVLFLFSLLAKQVSVTLPVILLLLDWYPLGRLHKDKVPSLILEKIPFFTISLLISWATLYFAVAEKKLISMASMPFLVRLVVSGNAVFEYCRLSLFPVGISPYFVLPKPLPYSYPVKTFLVVAGTLLLLRSASRCRGIATAWFCFVITLAPMLAFIQAGDDIAMATRYTYLPSIAPTIGVAVLLLRYLGAWRAKGQRILAAATVGLILLSCFWITATTLKLTRAWRDTGTFWSRVIDIAPVGRAYGDRGVYYLINGRSSEAVGDFSAAIGIAINAGQKSVYNLYAFRGVALSDIGRYAEAVADFDRAIALFPNPTYFQLRGTALQTLGRAGEAAEDFRRAGPNPPAIDWF